MKKKLLFAGLSFLSVLAIGQKNDKVVNSNRISDFKNRMYLSTSKDPMLITNVKTLNAKEQEAKKLVAPQTSKSNNLKVARVEKAIDTTYTYPWNVLNQDWDTVPVARMISFYDRNHNLIQYSAFGWNYEKKDWQDSVQFFYKYNDADLLMDVYQQSWQFDGYKDYSWVNVDHYVYKYNDLGKETKFIYQYWDYGYGDWVDSWQHELNYDEKGNNTLILETYWDGIEWTPGINFINKYDTLNQVTLNLIQVWDYNSYDWSDVFQYIYGYDKSGNNISMILQTWNPDEVGWDNCQLEKMDYNSSNKIDNYLFQLWDPFTFVWYDVERGVYKYDSIGNNISIEGQYYDPFSESWTTSWKNIFDYNSKNKQISNASLFWDPSVGNWFYGTKTKDIKIKYAVEPPKQQVVAVTTFEVYPNPAADFVNIRNNVTIDQVKVYDILGKEILANTNIGLKSFQINISNLKSGNYFLKIKNSNGTMLTGRVVKR